MIVRSSIMLFEVTESISYCVAALISPMCERENT
jgi:hypothetical protein